MEGFVLALAVLFAAAPLIGLAVAIATRARLRELERRVRFLEAAAVRREAERREVAAAPSPPPVAPPAPRAFEAAPAASVFAAPTAPSVFAAPSVPPPAPPAAGPGTTRDHVGWRGLEGRLGGTWLSRIGAVVVTTGIGFFLQHAFDSGWIQPAGRVALGVASGVAMLVVGDRLQRAAYRVPAQALVAAGSGALYLAIFAAFAFYRLLPQPLAFAFMALVTATTLALAIHHEARAIAVLASLGGFATPVLLSTGRDAGPALFAYLAILDAGLVACAYWRRWPELTALGFAFTHLMYYAWFARWYATDPPQRLVALVAATGFLALFSLVAVVESRGRQRVTPERVWQVTGIVVLLAPAVYFAAARAILWPTHTAWLAALCLALTACYVGLARLTASARGVGGQLLLLHGAIALGFLTLTFPIQFAPYGASIAWSVEGAALVWGGSRLRSTPTRVAGLAVLGLAAARWIFMVATSMRHAGALVVDNPILTATVVFVVATALAARLYRPDQPGATDAERFARPWLVVAAVGAAALFLTLELDQHQALLVDPALRDISMTAVWLVAGALLLAAAAHDCTPTLAGAAALTLLGVAVKSATLDVEQWRWLAPTPPPVLNARFAVGLLVAASLAAYARRTQVFALDATGRRALRLGALAAATLYLLWHLTAEVLLAPWTLARRDEVAMARNMTVSILWTAYALAAMLVGVKRRAAMLRFGAMALFAVVVLKVFLVDLGRLDAGYRILSFLVLGAVLIGASFVYTRYRDRIVEPSA
jgi:uncharacterized membrane protein